MDCGLSWEDGNETCSPPHIENLHEQGNGPLYSAIPMILRESDDFTAHVVSGIALVPAELPLCFAIMLIL